MKTNSLGVDLGFPDPVLVLVERRGQLLVALDVLQLVAEAVEDEVVVGRGDAQTGELDADLLLEEINRKMRSREFKIVNIFVQVSLALKKNGFCHHFLFHRHWRCYQTRKNTFVSRELHSIGC